MKQIQVGDRVKIRCQGKEGVGLVISVYSDSVWSGTSGERKMVNSQPHGIEMNTVTSHAYWYWKRDDDKGRGRVWVMVDGDWEIVFPRQNLEGTWTDDERQIATAVMRTYFHRDFGKGAYPLEKEMRDFETYYLPLIVLWMARSGTRNQITFSESMNAARTLSHVSVDRNLVADIRFAYNEFMERISLYGYASAMASIKRFMEVDND